MKNIVNGITFIYKYFNLSISNNFKSLSSSALNLMAF